MNSPSARSKTESLMSLVHKTIFVVLSGRYKNVYVHTIAKVDGRVYSSAYFSPSGNARELLVFNQSMDTVTVVKYGFSAITHP